MNVCWKLSLFGFVLYCVKNFCHGQSCFSEINESQFSNQMYGLNTGLSQNKSMQNTLILFQNLRFANNGSIERWEGHLQLESISVDECETLLFLQVWRPWPSDESLAFTLVRSSPLSSSKAIATGNSTIRIDVNKNVENDSIFFQQDDIVGIYVVADIAEAGVTYNPELMMNDGTAMMKDIVVTTSQAPCQVSSSDKWKETQPRLPTIRPYCFGSPEEMDEGSLSFVCNQTFNDNQPIACNGKNTESPEEMDEGSLSLVCNQTFNDNQPIACNDTTPASEGRPQVVVGLFFIVIASCIAVASIIAVVTNCVIVCRAWCKHKQVKDRLLDGPIQRSTCNFIVNSEALQNDLPPNVRSLAEFLQYNIHHENTTERLNISWV